MALKQTLASWALATEAWDKGDARASLDYIKQIVDPSSKILFNIGCAYLAVEDYPNGLQYFSDSISKDEHMAIAYYQRACVHYKSKRFRKAKEDFHACQTRFRGRSVIDYGQLGLKYKLYLCESAYNIGLCEARLGNLKSAEEIIKQASKCKVELRHRFMTEAVETVMRGEIPDLTEIPRDAIYRPPKGKVDNMEKRDYLGKAKVISSLNQEDGFSGFVGPKKLEEKMKQLGLQDYQKAKRTGKGALDELIMTTLDPDLMRRRQSSEDPPLVSSAPNSPRQTPKLLRQRSKDDLFIGTTPERPPKSSVIDGRNGKSSRSLPPPPNRPPPKLDRKPLPPEPGSEPGTIKGLVKVEFNCITNHTVEVTPGTSLEYLVCTACQHFGLEKDSINLWKKNNIGKHVPILTEDQMKTTWEEVKEPQLSLWCYAKQ